MDQDVMPFTICSTIVIHLSYQTMGESKENLVRMLEDNWAFGGVSSVELVVIREFENRFVYRFRANEGIFVCKVIPDVCSNDEMEERIFIYDFLKERGFQHIPDLIKMRSEKYVFTTEKQLHILVMEHIDGGEPAQTVENYGQLGGILGKLNNIADYPKQALISVDAIRPGFPKIAEQLPDDIRNEYLFIAHSLPDIDQLPQALLHFEANLPNSVQRKDGTIVLVDWDEAGNGAVVLDPGLHFVSVFLSEDLDFDEVNAKAFYSAYLKEHPLSSREKEWLLDASVFHALRYVVWGDPLKRWKRIKWALDNRDLLMSVLN